MNEPTYNPNDPQFLASQRLDGPLTPEQARQLAEAMATSPALQVEVARLSAVHELVQRWAKVEPAGLDRDLAAEVRAFLEQDASGAGDGAGGEAVDGLLQRWAQRAPRVDEDELLAGVLAEIAPAQAQARRRTSAGRWLLRLGTPMAAAAALALAFVTLYHTPPTETVVTVTQVAVVRPVARPAGPSVCEVRINREPPAGVDRRAARPSVSFSMAGAGSAPTDPADAWPL